MKKLFFLSAFLYVSETSFAQIDELLDPANEYCLQSNNAGISHYPFMKGKYISTYSFNRLLRKDFTLMSTNEEGLPYIGNYAVIKLSDNDSKIALNGSFFNPFIKNGSSRPIKNILSLGLKGGISEGVSTIFSNTRFNNSAGLSLRYSIINWRKTQYEYSAVSCVTLDLNRQLLKTQYNNETRKLDILRSDLTFDIKKMLAKKALADEKLLEVNTEIACVQNLNLPQAKKDEVLDVLNRVRDEQEKSSLAYFDSITQKRLALQDTYTNTDVKLEDLRKAYLQKLYEYETKHVKWTSMKIRWFDVFVKGSGSAFNLINPKDSIHHQIVKKKFQQFEMGVSWNTFRSNPFLPFLKWGYFTRFTLQLQNSNNLRDANKREVESVMLVDSTDFNRRIIEKTTAYKQSFIEDFSFNPTFQVSSFLNENRNRGLSIYTNAVWKYKKFWQPFKADITPDMNIGAGYFLTILDKAKETGVINFEIFLRFLDIFNTAEDESNFYSRNELGIKIGLPFRSIFLNQHRLL